MTYREMRPHPALRFHVDRFWMRSASAGSPERGASLRILPDGCIDVLFDLSASAGRLVGTMTRAVLLAPERDTCIAAVRFRPAGAPAFLKVPARLLTDRVLSLGELGLSWLEPLATFCQEPVRVIARLEAALLARLADAPLDAELLYATRRFFAPRPPSVAELARELGRSRQHLARGFREHVGISPKELGRIARLQRAVDLLQRAPASSLARAALDLGYCDQAHMSRDFRELAGLTPDSARAATGSIFPIPSLWREA